MRTLQVRSTQSGAWVSVGAPTEAAALVDAQLVLVFGNRKLLQAPQTVASLKERFPRARIVACSGDAIASTCADGDGVVATAVEFRGATVTALSGPLHGAAGSASAGEKLARQLPVNGLRHVLVFAEGLHVNGSALVQGISRAVPTGVTVSGGLAGDSDAFGETVVGLDAPPTPDQVVLLGFYGDELRIGLGTYGGWEPFGPDRIVTRSEGNVLYELDGRRALDLYKELLGPLGYALPASGLMFPLKVRADVEEGGVIRTILSVDEEKGSLTFAGDVPQGHLAKLMRTSLDALVDAARQAAKYTVRTVESDRAELIVAVSCIGRKLLLQRRVNEELVGAQKVIGPGATMAGFYSYGEIAPSGRLAQCALHNQTMTITTFAEV